MNITFIVDYEGSGDCLGEHCYPLKLMSPWARHVQGHCQSQGPVPGGQRVRQRPVDPLLTPCPGLLASLCSIGSNLASHVYGGMWLHIRTGQTHRFVNLQCRLFVMMTLILSSLKNRYCFLRACESHMWYKKKLLVISRKQQETQEEGVGGEALRWKRRGVMFILEIFSYQSIF